MTDRIPQDQMDKVDRKVVEDISRTGWSDISVFPTQDSPGLPFNYTVGFAEFEHPDLIMIGLNNEQAHGVLWAAFNQIKAGTRYNADEYYEEILVEFPVGFVEVLEPMNDDFPMSMTRRLYGEVHALQLVWPDKKGMFPWHNQFDAEYRDHQPLLGVWSGV